MSTKSKTDWTGNIKNSRVWVKIMKDKIKKYIKGRVAIFVDVSNIYYSQRTLGWEIDYQKIINLFKKESKLLFAYFYSGVDSRNKAQQNFLKKMENFGYTVKTKEIKWIKDRKSKIVKGKGNLDIELALDMSQKTDEFDTVVLFSGDSDFASLVRLVRSKHKTVIIVSSRGHVAKELIREANKYIPFESLKDIFVRIKKSPPPKRGEV